MVRWCRAFGVESLGSPYPDGVPVRREALSVSGKCCAPCEIVGSIAVPVFNRS